MVNKIRSCVLISGNGSNLRSLIKSSRDYNFPIKIQLIISNNPMQKGFVLLNSILFHTNFFHLIIKKNLKEIVCLKLKKEKLNSCVLRVL
jgi:phosphoribosylglycinamide formyltransferase-1